jgi:hypothetical protein
LRKAASNALRAGSVSSSAGRWPSVRIVRTEAVNAATDFLHRRL